jgi:hypothetical protein
MLASLSPLDVLIASTTRPDQTIVLDLLLTVSDVLMLYWEAKSELHLLYRLHPLGLTRTT